LKRKNSLMLDKSVELEENDGETLAETETKE